MSGSPEALGFDERALREQFDPGNNLTRFYELLMEENQRVNLVSRETSRETFDRMAAECFLPLTVLSANGAWHSHLDIGAGGGFPLIPIALAGRTEKTAACERTQKKASALIRMTKGLGLDITITPRTFEDIHFEETFDLITLRYVKLTSSILSGISKVLAEDGVFVYYSEPSFAVDHLQVRRFRFQTSPAQPFKHFSLISRK